MQYEVNGRDDVEAAGTDANDVHVTGIGSTHAKIRNRDTTQHVIFSLGLAPTFPASWSRVEPEKEVEVFLNGATQINLRKKVYYRNIGWNPDETTRLNDVPVTIEVEEKD
jgi:hypothetical protein